MAKTINLHEAKTLLSRLVEQNAAGEEIVICKGLSSGRPGPDPGAGKPKARLVALAPERKLPRVPGLWKDKVWISEDFDEPLPDDLLEL